MSTDTTVNPIDVAVCSDAEDATQRGYVYREPEYRFAELKKLVIVRNGTQQGNATVDLIFTDENGKKYVAITTARLLNMALAMTGPKG